jgi:hypothetical protein
VKDGRKSNGTSTLLGKMAAEQKAAYMIVMIVADVKNAKIN